MATIVGFDNKIVQFNNKILQTNWNGGEGLKFEHILGAQNTWSTYVNIGNRFGFNVSDTFSFSTVVCSTRMTSLNAANPIALFSKHWDDYIGYFCALNRITTSGLYSIRIFMQNTQPVTYSKSVFFTTDIFTNKVVHITFTINTINDIKIYLNGVEQVTTESGTKPASITNSRNFVIGGIPRFTGSWFGGVMSDLKIFNKALSPSEVKELYFKQNQIVPVTALANLQGDYRFNNKQGTVLTDYSSNAYNGTLTNYLPERTTFGVNNYWVDVDRNPITQY